MVGRTLLHYRIVDRLGKGGMGEVYLAGDMKLGRRVALKLLPEAMASSPEFYLRKAVAVREPMLYALSSWFGLPLDVRRNPRFWEILERFGSRRPAAGRAVTDSGA